MAQVISDDKIVDLHLWSLPEVGDKEQCDTSQSEQAGFRVGYQKGLEQAKKIAKDELENQVIAELTTELQSKIDLVNQLMRQLEKPMLQISDEVELEIVKLIEGMLCKLVQRDLQLHPETLRTIVKKALQLLPVENNNVTIYVARDDVAVLTNQLVDLVDYLRVDDTLTSGDFKIAVKDSLVDGTVQHRVANLTSQMRDVQQPVLAIGEDDE